MIGRKDENGPQGDGVNEDVCFTLDATDRHAVCAPEDVYAMTTGSYMQVAKLFTIHTKKFPVWENDILRTSSEVLFLYPFLQKGGEANGYQRQKTKADRHEANWKAIRASIR